MFFKPPAIWIILCRLQLNFNACGWRRKDHNCHGWHWVTMPASRYCFWGFWPFRPFRALECSRCVFSMFRTVFILPVGSTPRFAKAFFVATDRRCRGLRFTCQEQRWLQLVTSQGMLLSSLRHPKHNQERNYRRLPIESLQSIHVRYMCDACAMHVRCMCDASPWLESQTSTTNDSSSFWVTRKSEAPPSYLSPTWLRLEMILNKSPACDKFTYTGKTWDNTMWNYVKLSRSPHVASKASEHLTVIAFEVLWGMAWLWFLLLRTLKIP